MANISPLASIHPSAELADDVEIGPFCAVGHSVRLGAGSRLINSVTILPNTSAGERNVFFPNCVIGAVPQDMKYRGEETFLEIGDANTFRENVTIHRGTAQGGYYTRIGSHNLFMVNAHIGHDAQWGSHTIVANNVMIAGHVVAGDHVALMGGTGVHHYVTLGEFVYTGGYSRVTHDVPPFVKIDGNDNVRGLNTVGLRRAGFLDADIAALEKTVRHLFYNREIPFSRAMAELDAHPNGNGEINPHVHRMLEFLRRRNAGIKGRYLEGQRSR
ncbi:MAG: acyl-ACP--UDP-N-acetylglucosamine O-acyltransferase [Phycisphaerae bacterium]